MQIACVGDELVCPRCPHPPWYYYGHITQGSPNVYIGGRPAARVGDLGHCGNITVLVTGSPLTYIDGRNAHRVGDLNSCQGPTIRSNNVFTYSS